MTARDGPRTNRGNPNEGMRGLGTGNAPATREGFLQKRARLLACGRCGAIVDWLTAFKQVATGIYFREGAGCSSRACSRRHRPSEHVLRQRQYIDGVVNGERTLMRTPADTRDSEWHAMSYLEATRAIKRALERIE